MERQGSQYYQSARGLGQEQGQGQRREVILPWKRRMPWVSGLEVAVRCKEWILEAAGPDLAPRIGEQRPGRPLGILRKTREDCGRGPQPVGDCRHCSHEGDPPGLDQGHHHPGCSALIPPARDPFFRVVRDIPFPQGVLAFSSSFDKFSRKRRRRRRGELIDECITFQNVSEYRVGVGPPPPPPPPPPKEC